MILKIIGDNKYWWHAQNLAQIFEKEYYTNRKLGIYHSVIYVIHGVRYYVYRVKSGIVVRVFDESES